MTPTKHFPLEGGSYRVTESGELVREDAPAIPTAPVAASEPEPTPDDAAAVAVDPAPFRRRKHTED